MRLVATICMVGLLQLTLAASAASTVAPTDARKLALLAIGKPDKHLVVEVDREHDGCTVYHAYYNAGEPPEIHTATIGWWSVDNRTAEVWDDGHSQRVTSPGISRLQKTIRKRLKVTSAEVDVALSRACYERLSN